MPVESGMPTDHGGLPGGGLGRVANPNVNERNVKMKNFILRLWKEEEGQDLIEYVLLVALIALLVAATFPALAAAITGVFTKAMNCVASPTAANC